VQTVNSEDELREACDQGADLLLINRELPFGFETEEGVELIRQLHSGGPKVKMMLISDLEDAQEEARQAGGVEGFGKADLGSEKFATTLRQALGEGQRAS
jgi:DNA-binding NarL/FixJ family response regulator